MVAHSRPPAEPGRYVTNHDSNDLATVDAQNPYTSPTVIAKANVESQPIDHSDSKFSRCVRILIRPSVALSLLAVVHFGASLCFWSIGGLIVIRTGSTVAAWLMLAWGAAPAMILFGVSIANVIRSIRKRRFATITMIGIYLISACLFCYDVSNERAQLQVGIATADYWENGGSKNMYFTWWWFNDGWFR